MRRFIAYAAIVACVTAGSLGLGAIGNALPQPWSDYVPMLNKNHVVWDEFVKMHALAQERTPCVALGDSRTAFNIAAKTLSPESPDGCSAQNYGYAALGLDNIKRVAEAVASVQRVRIFVLSVNEAMLMSGVADGTPLSTNHGQRLEAATRNWFLEFAPIRAAYLGHHRLFRFLRTRLHMTAPTENSGWTWSAERRQWRYAGLEEREFVSLPTYRQEHQDMARTYYANKVIRPDARDVMASTLAVLSRNADRVVVLIPPSERAFQEDAETLAPGLRSRIFDLIKDAALRSGAQLVDCSAPEACGMHPSGFADPIHFNDRGIESYSQALAPLVAEALR